MSDASTPVPPGLRPVAGKSDGSAADRSRTTDDTGAVLRQFGANRAAMAAEIVRLRRLLDEALFEVSRQAAAHPTVVTGQRAGLANPSPERPFGFGSRARSLTASGAPSTST